MFAAENIQRRKLFKGGIYLREYGMSKVCPSTTVLAINFYLGMAPLLPIFAERHKTSWQKADFWKKYKNATTVQEIKPGPPPGWPRDWPTLQMFTDKRQMN
jgi:hypothetical protein